jgi:hypothetical protein
VRKVGIVVGWEVDEQARERGSKRSVLVRERTREKKDKWGFGPYKKNLKFKMTKLPFKENDLIILL